MQLHKIALNCAKLHLLLGDPRTQHFVSHWYSLKITCNSVLCTSKTCTLKSCALCTMNPPIPFHIHGPTCPQVFLLRNAMLSPIANHPVLPLSAMCRSSFTACSYKVPFLPSLDGWCSLFSQSPTTVPSLLFSTQYFSLILFALCLFEKLNSSSGTCPEKLCLLLSPTVVLGTQIHPRMLLSYPFSHLSYCFAPAHTHPSSI